MAGANGWASAAEAFRSSTGHLACDSLEPMPILVLAALAAAQAAPDTAPDCDAATARAATFAEATAEAATGDCVSIEGVAVGRLLLEDGRSRYRRESRENDPSSTGAVLGFYAPQAFDQPTRVRVVGRIGNCEAMQREAEAANRVRATDGEIAITMLTGYCHYFRGQVIRAATVEVTGPAPLVRLTAASAGPDLGNLAPLAPGDLRSRMEAAAGAFLGAVRAGERDLLVTMHGGGVEGRRSQRDVESSVALILDAADSPFVPLRNRSGEIALELFGWKEPLWADADWRQQAARRGDADAIACFSASPDADRLWPIDSKDADNIPERPYACTRIRISGEGIDAPARFDTEQARSGVPENGPSLLTAD